MLRCRRSARFQNRIFAGQTGKMGSMSVIEDFIPERPQVLFDRKLRRAIFFGEHFGHVCGDSLDTETEAAIRAVAVQFPTCSLNQCWLHAKNLNAS